MLRYILQRFIGMIIVMFLVVTIVFIIVRVTPGDPAAVMLGPEATAADIAALRQQLGLDQSILLQYVYFIGNLFKGDLGQSIFLNQPVTAGAGPARRTDLLSHNFLAADRQRHRHSDRHLCRIPARLVLRSGSNSSSDAGRKHPELLAGPHLDADIRRTLRPVSSIRLWRARNIVDGTAGIIWCCRRSRSASSLPR